MGITSQNAPLSDQPISAQYGYSVVTDRLIVTRLPSKYLPASERFPPPCMFGAYPPSLEFWTLVSEMLTPRSVLGTGYMIIALIELKENAEIIEPISRKICGG